jgi:hypothetical protein
MALTTVEREYFMTGIATYMAATELPNQITGIQLSEVITELINSIPDSVSTASSAITSETTQPLRTRIRGAEYGVEHVKTDVRACGLLVDDPATPGSFRFGHKSFMEYLFASVVAERIQNKEAEKARAVLKATGANIEDILSLPVAIDFLSEMLVGNKDAAGVEQTARELSTATHLFRTILGESAGMFIFYRITGFVEILTYCIARGNHVIVRLLVRMATLTIIMAPALAMSIWDIFHVIGTPSTSGGGDFIKNIVTVFSALLLMIMVNPSGIVRKKLELWTQLCEKVGIQNKVLHEVVGTSLIPFVRDKPLDFHIYSARMRSGGDDDQVDGKFE